MNKEATPGSGMPVTSAKVVPMRDSSNWFVSPAALEKSKRTWFKVTLENPLAARSHPASFTGSKTVSPGAKTLRNTSSLPLVPLFVRMRATTRYVVSAAAVNREIAR